MTNINLALVVGVTRTPQVPARTTTPSKRPRSPRTSQSSGQLLSAAELTVKLPLMSTAR